MIKRFILAVGWFAVIIGPPAMARGGTDAHEMASAHHDGDMITSTIDCGRARYYDLHTHGCVGHADIAR